MSRLASLSTPARRDTQSQSPSPSPSPYSPTDSSRSRTSTPIPTPVPVQPIETTHHRMLKLVINEFKTVFKTWDELLQIDGIKFAKGVIDQGTIMDNILTQEEGPERELITPHLEKFSEYRKGLSNVLVKLDKLLGKLHLLNEQAEKLLFEAYRTSSYDFVFVEPLWLSWTMERFINSIPPLIHHHTNHLSTFINLSNTIQDTTTKFEISKKSLERWLALSRGGERWEAVREWEELVDLEIELGLQRMSSSSLVVNELDEDDWSGRVGSPRDGSGVKKKKGKGKK